MDHITANARAAKAQGVVSVEQSTGVEFVTQTVAQHRFVVQLALVGNGSRTWPGQTDLVVVGQALHLPHSPDKQMAFSLALFGRQRLGSGQSLSLRLDLGQFFPNFFQVLQRIDFHKRTPDWAFRGWGQARSHRGRVKRHGCASNRLF